MNVSHLLFIWYTNVMIPRHQRHLALAAALRSISICGSLQFILMDMVQFIAIMHACEHYQ